MLRYNTASRILFILTVIIFAIAAPVLVQEKRQASEGMITVLGKRTREQDLDMLWDGLRYNMWGNPHGPNVHHIQEPAPNAAEAHVQDPHAPAPDAAGVQPQEEHAPVPNAAGVQPQAVHVPPQEPVDPNREVIDVDEEAPPGTPKSGQSDSQPSSPVSTKPIDRFSGPSTGSESVGPSANLQRLNLE